MSLNKASEKLSSLVSSYNEMMMESRNFAALCETSPSYVSDRFAYHQVKLAALRKEILLGILNYELTQDMEVAEILEICRQEIRLISNTECAQILDLIIGRLVRMLKK